MFFFFLAFPWLDFQFWLIAPPFGFSSSRGLQQGEFLSPWLFILVMEILSWVWTTAVEGACLSSFQVRSGSLVLEEFWQSPICCLRMTLFFLVMLNCWTPCWYQVCFFVLQSNVGFESEFIPVREVGETEELEGVSAVKWGLYPWTIWAWITKVYILLSFLHVLELPYRFLRNIGIIVLSLSLSL